MRGTVLYQASSYTKCLCRMYTDQSRIKIELNNLIAVGAVLVIVTHSLIIITVGK